ncbi:hypothetical protein PMIN01_13600 [Paraphaeosphaeria minitans]|uniref:Uncharacterized protein n=1 Tax=Paraphaeosphaeria minitans TaxID=565426 RepID=A0A9P6KJ72_9PLEO|nr:hypothetical protein PMIN01_13600 [Paraphaeosphaeria minitans]
MDEKGFLIGVLSKMKRVFFKSGYEEGKLKHIVQDGNREWITTIACICISPFNPSVILKRFKTAQGDDFRPNSSASSSSVLSASDWRKIERLLRQAVDDIYDANAKKLSRTIHTISAKNQLLQHENDNLREALANEKKHRKRGKALLLEPPTNYNRGAVFWSPTKVAQARQRQEQKDLQEEALQHQKSEANKLRERQKLAKAQLLEEARLKRVAAKEERDRLAAEKALQREEDKMAKQLEKQLQSDIKLSQKGKRQSLKPTKAIETVVADENRHVVEEAVPKLTRKGRPIQPPKNLLT